jgi:hypothetical protein
MRRSGPGAPEQPTGCSSGKATKTRDEVYEVIPIEGIPFSWLVKMGDRDLTQEEAEVQNRKEVDFRERVACNDAKPVGRRRRNWLDARMVDRFDFTNCWQNRQKKYRKATGSLTLVFVQAIDFLCNWPLLCKPAPHRCETNLTFACMTSSLHNQHPVEPLRMLSGRIKNRNVGAGPSQKGLQVDPLGLLQRAGPLNPVRFGGLRQPAQLDGAKWMQFRAAGHAHTRQGGSLGLWRLKPRFACTSGTACNRYGGWLGLRAI